MQILKQVEREEGQGLVEYALLLVLIAVLVIAILTLLGSNVTLVFARVMGGFNGDTIEDGAVFLNATKTETVLGGSCRTQMSDIQFVGVDSSGNIINDGSTVSAKIIVNGTPIQNISGSAGGSGIVTVAGPVTVTGTGSCPLRITMSKN